MGLIALILSVVIVVFFFLLFTGLTLLSGLFGSIANVFRLFRLNDNLKQTASYNHSSRKARNTTFSSDDAINPSSNSKIFSPDEGFYVDFEEVKD